MGIKEELQKLAAAQKAAQEAAEKSRKDPLVEAEEKRQAYKTRFIGLITPHLEDLKISGIVSKIEELVALSHPRTIKRILLTSPGDGRKWRDPNIRTLFSSASSNITTLTQESDNPILWLPALHNPPAYSYAETVHDAEYYTIWGDSPTAHYPSISKIHAVGYRLIFARSGETDVLGDMGGDTGGTLCDMEKRLDVLVGRKTTGELEFIIDYNVSEPIGEHPHRITVGSERVDSHIAQIFLNNFHRNKA